MFGLEAGEDVVAADQARGRLPGAAPSGFTLAVSEVTGTGVLRPAPFAGGGLGISDGQEEVVEAR